MASADYFLKIDGVDGESTDPKQKGSIAITEWTWGATQNIGVVSASGGTGKSNAKVHELVVKAHMSAATTRLFMACASGEKFKTAELVCRKSGKEQLVFYKITMSDVFVVNVRQGGGGAHGELTPMEDVTLSFAKVEMEYKAQKEDGSVGAPIKGGWDLKTNKKS
jgi:type VI secretion system secreted protein Hcp